MEETNDCDKRHDHSGPWAVIALVFLGVLLWGIWSMVIVQHQFEVIYDRVGEMQHQLECPPTEAFLTDQDGNEYCVEIHDEEETE